MSKKIGFSLAFATILLAVSACSSPLANNQPAQPAVNPGPPSFSVTQTPVPPRTPTVAPVPVNTPVATTAPAGIVTNSGSTSTPPVPPPAPVSTPGNPPSQGTAQGSAQGSGTVTPPAAAKVQINIQNFAFNPAVITVGVGTTVTWTNEDQVAHQVASGSFNSVLLHNGESFSYKFTAAGTYDYHCLIHPSMTGKIIVQ
jgi:plastocyanin